MMYRNDPQTSTGDWIRLNFNEEHGPLIAHAIGEEFDALERRGHPGDFEMEEPEDPDGLGMSARLDLDDPDLPKSDGMTTKEYSVAMDKWGAEKAAYDAKMAPYREELAAYEKALEAHEAAVQEFEEELHGFPVAWNCMWSPRESVYGDQLDALTEAGFVVYSVSKHTDVPFGFDDVFGVDGGGYDFYDQHWKPLRAIVSRNAAQRWLGKGYGVAEETVREHNELVTFLANEKRNSEGEAERFIRVYSLAVPAAAAAE